MGLLDDWLGWRQGNRQGLLDATTAGADATLKALRQQPLDDAERAALVNTPAAWLGTDPISRTGAGRVAGLLDMAPEARAARAAEQGYTTDVYHGTLGDVAAFDRRGEGGVTFVTPDPAYASQYAGNAFTTGIARGGEAAPNVMPLKMRPGNSLDPSSPLPRQEALRVLDLALEGVPAMMRRAVREDALAKMGGGDTVPAIDLYNAIEYKVPVSTGDVFARAGYDTMRHGPEEWMVFKPGNLRSRFAAFDPARANDPDLLAAHTPAPFGLLTPDDERRKR